MVETPPAREATILLVEDEGQIRSFSKHALERAGYRVLEARSGTQALEVAQQHYGAVDMLVTDMVLPGQSGPELARALAGRRPGLRVLYTSGYHDAVPPGDAPGAFLAKPYMPNALVRRVEEVLSGGTDEGTTA